MIRTALPLCLALAVSPAVAAPPADERLELAVKGYRLAATGYREGRVGLEDVARWSTRIFQLQKATREPKAGADYVYRMKDLEGLAAARVKHGDANELEALTARYLRVEAELAAK